MLPSELHAVQETRGSKCVSIWEKQSGGLFRSECINPSEFAYGKPTSLVKGDSPQCGEMWRSDRGDGHRFGGGNAVRR